MECARERAQQVSKIARNYARARVEEELHRRSDASSELRLPELCAKATDRRRLSCHSQPARCSCGGGGGGSDQTKQLCAPDYCSAQVVIKFASRRSPSDCGDGRSPKRERERKGNIATLWALSSKPSRAESSRGNERKGKKVLNET